MAMYSLGGDPDYLQAREESNDDVLRADKKYRHFVKEENEEKSWGEALALTGEAAWKGLSHGTYYGAREMTYRAMRTVSRMVGSDDWYRGWTQDLERLKAERKADPHADLDDDIIESDYYRGIYEGLNSFMVSNLQGVGGAAVGAGAALAVGATGGLAAPALLGFAVAAGTGAGLGEYDSFLDEAYEQLKEDHPGLSRDQIEDMVDDNALMSAISEGGIEMAANLIGGKIMGVVGKGTGVSKILGQSVKETSKITHLLQNFLVRGPLTELPSEMATAVIQDKAREWSGMHSEGSWDAASNVIIPTLVSGGAEGAKNTALSHLRTLHEESAASLKRYEQPDTGIRDEAVEQIMEEDPAKTKKEAVTQANKYDNVLSVLATISNTTRNSIHNEIQEKKTITDKTQVINTEWTRDGVTKIVDSYERSGVRQGIEDNNLALIGFLPAEDQGTIRGYLREAAKDPNVAEMLARDPEADLPLTDVEHNLFNQMFKEYLISGLPENAAENLMHGKRELTPEELIAVEETFEQDHKTLIDEVKRHSKSRQKYGSENKNLDSAMNKMRTNMVEAYGEIGVEAPDTLKPVFEKLRHAHIEMFTLSEEMGTKYDPKSVKMLEKALGVRRGREGGLINKNADSLITEAVNNLDLLRGEEIDPVKYDALLAKGAQSNIINWRTREGIPTETSEFMTLIHGIIAPLVDKIKDKDNHTFDVLTKSAKAAMDSNSINLQSIKELSSITEDMDKKIVYAKMSVDLIASYAVRAVDMYNQTGDGIDMLEAENLIGLYTEMSTYYATAQSNIARSLNAMKIQSGTQQREVQIISGTEGVVEPGSFTRKYVYTPERTGRRKRTVKTDIDKLAIREIERRGGVATVQARLKVLQNFHTEMLAKGKDPYAGMANAWKAATPGAILNLYTNNLLSHISTPMVQAISGAGMIVDEMINRGIAGNILKNEVGGVKKGEATVMLKSLTSVWESLRLFKDVFAAKVTGKDLNQIEGLSDARGPAGEKYDAISGESFGLSGGIGKIVDYIGRAIDLPGSTIYAQDEAVKFVGKRGSYQALAHRIATDISESSGESFDEVQARWLEGPPQWQKDQIFGGTEIGKPQKVVVDKGGKVINRQTQKTVKDQVTKFDTTVRDRVEKNGKVVKDDLIVDDPNRVVAPPVVTVGEPMESTQFIPSQEQLAEQEMKDAGWTKEELDMWVEMVEEADEFAKYITFQTDLDGFAEKLDSARKESFAMTMAVPFFKTPVNIAKWISNRTPVLAGIVGDYNEVMAGDDIAKKQMYEARMATGTLMWTTAFSLAAAGKITGAGPSDRDEKEKLMTTGWRPYSLVAEDGTSYQLSRLDPMGFFLTTAATLMDAQADMDAEDLSTALTYHFASALKVASDKTYIRSFAEVMGAVQDFERNGPRFFGNMASGLVPYSALLRGVRQEVDPLIREVDGTIAGIMNTVPGWSDDLPERLNFLGESVKYDDRLGPNLASMVKVGQRVDDPLSDELLRLDMKNHLNMGKIQKVQAYQGRSRKLDASQWVELQKEAGQKVSIGGMKMRDALERIISSNKYQGMSDADKGSYIKATIGSYRKEAKSNFVNKYKHLWLVQ